MFHPRFGQTLFTDVQWYPYIWAGAQTDLKQTLCLTFNWYSDHSMEKNTCVSSGLYLDWMYGRDLYHSLCGGGGERGNVRKKFSRWKHKKQSLIKIHGSPHSGKKVNVVMSQQVTLISQPSFYSEPYFNVQERSKHWETSHQLLCS